MICTLGPKGERVLQGLAQVPDEPQAFFRQQGVFPLQIADAEIPRNVQGDRDDIRRDKALAQAARAEAVAVCMDDEVVHRRPVFDEDLARRTADGEIAFRNIEKRIVLAKGRSVAKAERGWHLLRMTCSGSVASCVKTSP